MDTLFKQPFETNPTMHSPESECGTIEVEDGDENGDPDPPDDPDEPIDSSIAIGLVLLVLILFAFLVLGD